MTSRAEQRSQEGPETARTECSGTLSHSGEVKIGFRNFFFPQKLSRAVVESPSLEEFQTMWMWFLGILGVSGDHAGEMVALDT